MFLGTALTLLLLWTPARAESLPALPVLVSLTRHSGPLCASSELLAHLNYRFRRVVPPGEGDDIQLTCSENSEQLVVDVRAGAKGIGRFRVERTPSSSAWNTAYLAAHAVAKDPEVIAAALDAYAHRNALLAENAAGDLLAGRWSYAAAMFSRGLESDVKPSVVYYGLYRAEAEMGHPTRAKWYLSAFLKSSGRKTTSLSDEQIAPLAKALRSGAKEDFSQPDADFDEYLTSAAAQDWHRALYELHQIVANAPWYEPAYVSLAESYKGLGWKRLASIWGERAAFVGRVDKDADLGRDIELRADDAP